MRGMNAATGRPLDGYAHLRQSIRDILATPVGTRVMRRDYGSRCPDLTDAPITRALLVDIFAAVAEALDRWEPRFRLARIETRDAAAGSLELLLTGIYLHDGKEITLEGIIL